MDTKEKMANALVGDNNPELGEINAECPACGRPCSLLKDQDRAHLWHVKCDYCGLSGPPHHDIVAALALWWAMCDGFRDGMDYLPPSKPCRLVDTNCVRSNGDELWFNLEIDLECDLTQKLICLLWRMEIEGRLHVPPYSPGGEKASRDGYKIHVEASDAAAMRALCERLLR